MKKRIMSVNLNDLGGTTHHLMDYKYYTEYDRSFHVDWKKWANLVEKAETWRRFKDYIEAKQPDILVIEEMLVSRYEKIDYFADLKDMGYSYFEESLPERGNYSLTMLFFRGGNPMYINSPGNYRGNRTVIYRDKDMLAIGTHFPYNSDEKFLNNIFEFVVGNLDQDFLLIGDLNANDPTRGNKKMVNMLLDKGAVDLWTAAGNDENTPTEARYRGRLDYAIASRSLCKKVKNIKIDSFPMETGITDHAAVIVDIDI